jgi:Lytic polysaccharide mono-oxygenase, cellulose-degrading
MLSCFLFLLFFLAQDVEIEIELTANHYGRFELYLCPNNNPSYEATQECFDRYPLYLSGTRNVGFSIPRDSMKSDIFKYSVTLPAYVTCTQCVLQWTYYTGNMWGICPNGTESVDCGKPETFRNCADVSIVSSTGGGRPPIFSDDNEWQNPFLIYYRDNRAQSGKDLFPLVVR